MKYLTTSNLKLVFMTGFFIIYIHSCMNDVRFHMNLSIDHTKELPYKPKLAALTSAKLYPVSEVIDSAIMVGRFAERFSAVAISEMKKTGIPASFKIAMSALESRYGQSSGAVDHNAYFGIHVKSVNFSSSAWSGEWWEGDADETGKLRKLCKYENAWNSWRHHSQFLQCKPERYGDLFKCNDKFPPGLKRLKCWCDEIDKTGYSETEGYGFGIYDIATSYGWDKLDLQ